MGIKKEIDIKKNIKDEYIEYFEKRAQQFVEEYSEEEILQQVEHIADLLNVSKKNFELIKNQNWFKRVWSTITGENKELKEINQKNLLEVQKCSILLLQYIATYNKNLTKVINQCLEEIEYNTQENFKLKMYILEWTKRNNDKNKKIEKRIEKCEERIKNIESKSRFGFTQSIKNIFRKKDSHNDEIDDSELQEKNLKEQIIKQNSIIRKNLKNNFLIMLDNVARNYSYDILYPVKNMDDNINNIWDKVPDENIQAKELSNAILKTINLNLIDKFELDKIVNDISTEFYDYYNSLSKDIIKLYIPNSLAMIYAEVDMTEKNILSRRLKSLIQPIEIRLDNLKQTKYILLDKYDRYNEILTKNDIIEFGKDAIKGFAAGALFGIPGIIAMTGYEIFGDDIKNGIADFLGMETESMCYKNFSDNFSFYMDAIEDLKVEISNICDDIYNELKVENKKYLDKLDFIFNDFDEFSVSLEELNKEILEIIMENQ